MASKVNRRRFLTKAGLAAGTTVAATGGSLAAGQLPIPLPDAKSKAPAPAGAQPVCCTGAGKLIFACSGSADVGKIADLAARKLHEDGAGKMFCLAGIGGRVKGILDGTRSAQAILVLDGCPLHCGRHSLEEAGFKRFEHLCLKDLGMEKGKTPATEQAVAKVARQGKARLTG